MNRDRVFDRLFDKAIIQENGCWEYCGYIGTHGYGQIRIGGRVNGKLLRTHRVAYDLVKGDIPKGINVLHTCDNPKCVNPDHLFLGTQQDNVDDCINKGRRGFQRRQKMA